MPLVLLALAWGQAAAAAPEEKAQPVLRLEDGGAELRFDEATEQFRRTLWITSLNARDVDALRLDATSLRDADGVAHELQVTLGAGGTAPQRVEGLGRVPLSISARLPRGGPYQGELALLYAGGRHPVRLVVTRVRVPLSIELSDLAPVRAHSGDAVEVRFTLTETAGQPLVVRPEIASVLLKEKGNTYQTKMTQQDAKQPEAIALSPYGSVTQVMSIPFTAAPGEYSVTLRMNADGAKPLDVPVSVFVKDPGGVAFFWIGLGVAASFVLREYVTRFRPRVVRRRRASRLLEALRDERALGEPPEVTEGGVLDALQHQARKWLSGGGAGDQEAEVALAVIEAKWELFQRWRPLRRQLATLNSYSVNAEFAAKLSNIQRLLLEPGGNLEVLADQRRVAESMPQELEAALRDILGKALKELKDEVEAARADLSSPLAPLLEQQVVPLAEESLSALGKGNLSDAVVAYNEARRAYASLLVEQLGRLVEEHRPLHTQATGEPEWAGHKARIQGQLDLARQQLSAGDVDRAVATYQAAYALLLRAHVRTLAQEATAREAPGQAMTDAQRQGLQKVRTLVETSLRQVDARQFNDASRSYREAREAFLGLPGMSQRGAQAPVPLQAVGAALGATGLVPPFPRLEPRGLPSERHLTLRLLAGDLVVTLFIGGLACLLGLLTLWKNEPTWGGLGSYVVALLWGLGVHLTGFTGIAGLRETVLGRKEME